MSSSSVSKGNPKNPEEEIGYYSNYGIPVSPDHSEPPQFTPGPIPPLRYVRCDYCAEEHPCWSDFFCPKKPCTMCFKPGHDNSGCPFRHHIPRGASYDRVKYNVVCWCGEVYFDEEKWHCPRCLGSPSPRLVLKSCVICDTMAHHCTVDCPKDKIAAAGFRAEKEYRLTHDMYPRILKCPSPSEIDAILGAARKVREEIDRVVRAAREREALRQESGEAK